MFWECPAWAAIRASFPSLATSGPWPPCFRLCGIVPLALAPTATRRLELAHTVQSMLARILTAHNPAPADAAPPGAAPPRPASHPPPAVPWLYMPDGPTTTFPHFLPVPSPTFWIYSPAHFCAFRSYIGRLLWPASPPDVRPPPITFLELALDFELTTGVLLPPMRGAGFRVHHAAALPALWTPSGDPIPTVPDLRPALAPLSAMPLTTAAPASLPPGEVLLPVSLHHRASTFATM